MKKNKILKIFIAIVLLISVKTSAIAATTGIVNTDTARVRNKPSTTNSKIVTLVSIGDKITITGEENDWYKVKVNGMEGYIRKDLLTVDGKTAEKNEQKPSSNQQTTTEKPVQNPIKNENQEAEKDKTTGKDTTIKNEIQTNGEVVNEGNTGETTAEGKNIENGDKNISTIKVTEGLLAGVKVKLTKDTKIKILPSANSSNIAELQADTEVTVVEIINSWCRIEAGDNIGWVRIDQ